MHAGADEAAAHPGAWLWSFSAVVDDEVQQLAEVVVAGPAVKLFPLVGAHEPVYFGSGMLLMPVFSDAPAPAGRRKLQIELTHARPGASGRGKLQHVQALSICEQCGPALFER